MKGSDFIFNCINLHYKLHKINLKRGASYIDSPDWISKKETINSINDHNKYLSAVQFNNTIPIPIQLQLPVQLPIPVQLQLPINTITSTIQQSR